MFNESYILRIGSKVNNSVHLTTWIFLYIVLFFIFFLCKVMYMMTSFKMNMGGIWTQKYSNEVIFSGPWQMVTPCLFSHLLSFRLAFLMVKKVTNICYEDLLPCWCAAEPEIKLPKSTGSLKKQESSRKNIYFYFIDYAKAFDCVDHNKLWKILKDMGIPDHLTCLFFFFFFFFFIGTKCLLQHSITTL